MKAANGLIDQNFGRLGKELWTDLGEGEPLNSLRVITKLMKLVTLLIELKIGFLKETCEVRQQFFIDQCAIKGSREVLLRSQIPYKIYGGRGFFERMEIKNVLAYMRLISQPRSDSAFERVVNTRPEESE